MSPEYEDFGIGVAFDATADYDWYWTAVFGTEF